MTSLGGQMHILQILYKYMIYFSYYLNVFHLFLIKEKIIEKAGKKHKIVL